MTNTRKGEAADCGFPVPPDMRPDRQTVKRPDLFGAVHETHMTESELNGWRPSQGRLI